MTSLDGTFLVVNGDLLTTLDFGAMVDFHAAAQATATVGVYRRRVSESISGVLEMADDDVTRMTSRSRATYDASVGAYVMEPEVLDFIPSNRQFDLPDRSES